MYFRHPEYPEYGYSLYVTSQFPWQCKVQVQNAVSPSDMKVLNYGLKKEFLDRYDVEEVLKDNRLDAEMIAEDVKGLL